MQFSVVFNHETSGKHIFDLQFIDNIMDKGFVYKYSCSSTLFNSVLK